MIFLQAATLIIGIISVVLILKLIRKETNLMIQITDLRDAVRELKQSVADELQRVTDDLEAKKARQSAASTGRDADEFATAGRLSLYSRRDLSPVDQDKLIQMANYVTSGNLLGSRIKKIYRDFVIGDGVKFDAEDKTVIQPLL